MNEIAPGIFEIPDCYDEDEEGYEFVDYNDTAMAVASSNTMAAEGQIQEAVLLGRQVRGTCPVIGGDHKAVIFGKKAYYVGMVS